MLPVLCALSHCAVESEAAAQGDRQTAENKCVNISAEKWGLLSNGLDGEKRPRGESTGEEKAFAFARPDQISE